MINANKGYMKMRNSLLVLFTIFSFQIIPYAQDTSQKTDAIIEQLYEKALVDGHAYENLRYLCKEIGPRLTGSPGAASAVDWGQDIMKSYGFDSVWLQPVMVPHWVRGAQEKAKVVGSKRMGDVPLTITALGNSVGTGPFGISAEVVEVEGFQDLKAHGEEKFKGKIVFFNKKMNNAYPRTFMAYSEAGFIRYAGPAEAGMYGAIGTIVRSLGTETDDFPHTGSTSYKLNTPKVPAVAISTKDADMLSQMIVAEGNVRVYLETHCEMHEDKLSYNVVGEMKGTENPEKIIVVGGHLDSWDLAEGAHDDGAGIVQSLEALRLLNEIGYKPKNTLRVVFFMNEENGLRGGKAYAKWAEENNVEHICGIESDAGGFTPRAFSVDAELEIIERMQRWVPHFQPYGLYKIEKGYGGADISPLKNQGVITIGLRPDSQRYFVYHHSALDTFDKVNRRELHLGAASMAALMYMIDSQGL
jgi:carboxypeptidase Q